MQLPVAGINHETFVKTILLQILKLLEVCYQKYEELLLIRDFNMIYSNPNQSQFLNYVWIDATC